MTSARFAFQTAIAVTQKALNKGRSLKKKKSNPLVNRLLFLHHTIYPNSFLFYTENKNKNIDSINLGNFLEVNFNFSQIYIKNIPPFLLSASSSLSTEAVTHTPNS